MPDPVPLSQYANKIPLRKQLLSELVATELLKLFRISVLATMALTGSLAVVDYAFIGFGLVQADERLVTENVLMAIIGATIIQLGACVAAIVYALFKQPKSENEVAESE